MTEIVAYRGGSPGGAGERDDAIPALVPRDGNGHQFVLCADSCSGVPGAPEEAIFAAVNAVVDRLRPRPEFIGFPGDEIVGLTIDDSQLRRQWEHWLGIEMAWLDTAAVPLYNCPGNHTAYDTRSERVFREVLAHLPRNGPAGQEGLAYHVRRGNLLLVFVDTLWSGSGGEGQVETEWLDRTLAEHADARHKLVFGHHPVHPVLGRTGPHELAIEPGNGREFWRVLVERGVQAYLCSHLLTFDVQVHQGVLQILSGGAGRTREFPHCVQVALDAQGLRYQVLDTAGRRAKGLDWPPILPPSDRWEALATGTDLRSAPAAAPGDGCLTEIVAWRISGERLPGERSLPRTLFCGWEEGTSTSSFWLGLWGREGRLCVQSAPAPGRSPAYWLGPRLDGGTFSVQIALHPSMGPGGVLWRWNDESPWSSMESTCARGPDTFPWPSRWSVGHDRRGPEDRPFRGTGLDVRVHGCRILSDR